MPTCPSCIERLSAGELGFNGWWSCLYCEGVWLPFAAVEALGHSAGLDLTRYLTPPADSALRRGDLHCPGCKTPSFIRLQAKEADVYSCCTCRGLFIPKPAHEAFARNLGMARAGSVPRGVQESAVEGIALALAMELLTSLLA